MTSLFQAYGKLHEEHFVHAAYFESKAKLGHDISEPKRDTEILCLYDAMGRNKKLIELVIRLAEDLRKLDGLGVVIPTMPADQVCAFD